MFKKLKTKTTKAIEISTVTISGVIAGVIGLLILRFYNFRSAITPEIIKPQDQQSYNSSNHT
jgi:hypothetical protein